MRMQIFGTNGQSATIYDGPAQFRGELTLSNTVYSSQQQQCPTGRPVPFSCQGRLYSRGNFECQANLGYGGGYRIIGLLGEKKTTSQNYEIISVQVTGPCTVPGLF